MVERRLFHVTIEGFCKHGPWAWSNYIVADNVTRACEIADAKVTSYAEEAANSNVRISDVRYAGVVFIDQTA